MHTKINELGMMFKKLVNLAKRTIAPTHRKVFVVQKHSARTLHYDFRIEAGNVLKSWAIPKGFPKNYIQKRLAIETQNHPISYANFEGSIAEGEYGADTVKIYDKGVFENLSRQDRQVISINEALARGHIDLLLHGHVLQGKFTLVFFKESNGHRQWILRRSKLLD